jgi:stage II sporulation protein GA (sporulation sigma-E factor processing peptidase)
MEQGVYVDILLVTNYIVNLCIILCVGRFSGGSPKRRRIVAAALLGAATSLTIFLPLMGPVASVLLKAAISAAIVLAAFGFEGIRLYIMRIFLFFAISFCFAGVMLGLWLLFEPPGMSWNNGVVYFDISAALLVASTAAAYAVLRIAARLTQPRSLPREILNVSVCVNGKAAALKGLVDTGNRLKEPFSGLPVAVCEARAFLGVLPDGHIEAALRGGLVADTPPPLRMVPYADVGGTGVLPAFKPDMMLIEAPGGTLKASEVYVGLSREKIGDERYDCLLGPELMAFTTKQEVAAK